MAAPFPIGSVDDDALDGASPVVAAVLRPIHGTVGDAVEVVPDHAAPVLRALATPPRGGLADAGLIPTAADDLAAFVPVGRSLMLTRAAACVGAAAIANVTLPGERVADCRTEGRASRGAGAIGSARRLEPRAGGLLAVPDQSCAVLAGAGADDPVPLTLPSGLDAHISAVGLRTRHPCGPLDGGGLGAGLRVAGADAGCDRTDQRLLGPVLEAVLRPVRLLDAELPARPAGTVVVVRPLPSGSVAPVTTTAGRSISTVAAARPQRGERHDRYEHRRQDGKSRHDRTPSA